MMFRKRMVIPAVIVGVTLVITGCTNTPTPTEPEVKTVSLTEKVTAETYPEWDTASVEDFKTSLNADWEEIDGEPIPQSYRFVTKNGCQVDLLLTRSYDTEDLDDPQFASTEHVYAAVQSMKGTPSKTTTTDIKTPTRNLEAVSVEYSTTVDTNLATGEKIPERHGYYASRIISSEVPNPMLDEKYAGPDGWKPFTNEDGTLTTVDIPPTVTPFITYSYFCPATVPLDTNIWSTITDKVILDLP